MCLTALILPPKFKLNLKAKGVTGQSLKGTPVLVMTNVQRALVALCVTLPILLRSKGFAGSWAKLSIKTIVHMKVKARKMWKQECSTGQYKQAVLTQSLSWVTDEMTSPALCGAKVTDTLWLWHSLHLWQWLFLTEASSGWMWHPYPKGILLSDWEAGPNTQYSVLSKDSGFIRKLFTLQ